MRQKAMSSFLARATIRVLRVLPRASAVRARYHWRACKLVGVGPFSSRLQAHGKRVGWWRSWYGARRGGWPGGPRAEAQRGEAAHGGAPGRDGCGAAGRCGRAASLMRDLWASAGQQGPLPRDVPLVVRRRAGSGPAVARLPLPRPGRAEELRCRRPGAGPAPELAYVTAKFA